MSLHQKITGALVCLTLLLFASTAVAKEREFSPTAQSGQEVRFSDGHAVLISGNGLGNIAVSFVPLDKKSGYVRLWIENASNQQFNISETSVTATSGGAPLAVMTYADQVKAQRRKEVWAAVFAGIAAGANSYSASQAGYSNYSGYYNARTTSGRYTASTYGSYGGTSYNAGIAYLAQANAAAQNQAMFDRFSSVSKAAAQSLAQRSLKANTLMPGQSVLGDVRLTLPKGGLGTEMTVRIDVAGQPIDVNFRDGPPVIDSTPRPLAAIQQPSIQNVSLANSMPVGAPLVYSAPSVSSPSTQSPASAEALNHPSGPSARAEFVKLGCLENFNLVSSSVSHSIFEATCGSRKRQLMECYGSGCRPLN
jgi:hypothetical protein